MLFKTIKIFCKSPGASGRSQLVINKEIKLYLFIKIYFNNLIN
jgi:hypothetical protein